MAYNKKAVLTANTEAIRVVLRLEKERREATKEEKATLRSYQGFGGLKCVLNRCDSPDDLRYWSRSEQQLFEPTQRLKQMIYREAVDANTAKRYWESIKASVLTSFYTDTRIVGALQMPLTFRNVPICRCLDLRQVWEPLPRLSQRSKHRRCNGGKTCYRPYLTSPATYWPRNIFVRH
jgi:hypothetical protein